MPATRSATATSIPACVVLFASNCSARFVGSRQTAAFRGTYRALAEGGVDFDLIHLDRARDEDFAATHACYDSILLSGAAALSRAEREALDGYVAAGGTLVAFADAGMRGETGEELDGPALECLPIRSRGTPFGCRGSYLVLDEGSRLSADSDVLLMDGLYRPIVAAANAELRHRVLMPQRFGPSELCYPDDGRPSDQPGIIVGRHGRGRVVYLPWSPDLLFHEFGLPGHRDLICELASEFTAGPEVQLRDVPRIEVMVQRQAGSGDRLVHLVSYSGQSDNTYQDPVPVTGASLLLRGQGPFRCRAMVAEEDLAVRPTTTEGEFSVALPRIGGLEAVHVAG